MSLATRLLNANPGAQVSNALSGSLTTPGAKGAFVLPGNYELITTYTLTGTSTAINFNSIPQTYKHLEIRGVLQGTQGTDRGNSWELFQINGNATNYSYSYLRGYEGDTANGSKDVNSATLALGDALYQGANTSVFQTVIAKFNNYSETDIIKNFTVWSGWANSASSQNRIIFLQGNYQSTAAITSISFPNSNTSGFAIGSSLQLYGVAG